MSVDFQIASDLHIDYKKDYIPNPLDLITPKSKFLILNGDIGSLYKYEQLKGFLTELCKHFESVFYVPGNHEYYKLKENEGIVLSKLDKILKILENEIENLKVLCRESYRIGNICIAGCTLWSDYKENFFPKYIVRIFKMNKNFYNYLFKRDLSFIKEITRYCKSNKLKLLLVTHYPPSYKVLDNNTDKFASLYASRLDNLLVKDQIDTWVYGHVHGVSGRNFDFQDSSSTRLVSNQMGKPKDNIQDYSKEFVIKMET